MGNWTDKSTINVWGENRGSDNNHWSGGSDSDAGGCHNTNIADNVFSRTEVDSEGNVNDGGVDHNEGE